MTTHDYSQEHSDAFWVGHLAAAIDIAIRQPEIAKQHLKATLRRFRASPVCTPELDDILNRKEER